MVTDTTFVGVPGSSGVCARMATTGPTAGFLTQPGSPTTSKDFVLNILLFKYATSKDFCFNDYSRFEELSQIMLYVCYYHTYSLNLEEKRVIYAIF